MNSALPATLFLIASGGLHVLLLFGLTRSASGAESAWDESERARFVGNTFEIETLEALPRAAKNPTPEAPSAPSHDTASVQEREPAGAAAVPPVAAPAPVAPPIAAREPPHQAPADREPILPPAPLRPSAPEPQPEAGSGAPVATPPVNAAPSATATEATREAEATAAAPSAAPSGAAAYGQDAFVASRVSFAKAFTRAVPRIASADKVWHGLPLGSAGNAVFEIEVDARGKVVGQGTVLDKPVPAAHLARIVGRTVLLLRNQSFGQSSDGEVPVRQRFELSAEIRQVAALEDTFAKPEDLRQIGRLVEPTRVRPGKANFTYNSGRQVELSVRLLNP